MGLIRRVAPKHFSLAEKLEFHSMPEPNSGCVLWLAATDQDGYGFITMNGLQRRAHRAAYEVAKGPIPEGLVIDHLCCVPSCINPAHLEAVSVQTNTLRGVGDTAIAAKKTHCKRGHALSGENLGRDHRGHRFCRECQRMHSLNHHTRATLKRLQAELARTESEIARLSSMGNAGGGE